MKIKIICILLLTYIFLGEISAENQLGKFLTQFIFKFLLSKDSIVSKKTAEENQFNQVLIREKRSKPNQETEKTNEKKKCALKKFFKVNQKEQKLPPIKGKRTTEEYFVHKNETNAYTFLYGQFDVNKNLKKVVKSFINKKFPLWFKAVKKLKLFTKNLKHFKDQISKTVDSINVSKIPKKRKKVNIVLTYQRNGQVKFKDFGLAYTNDPVGKTTTCYDNIKPNKKKPKRIKRANGNIPTITCAEVGGPVPGEITIQYGPFEINRENPEAEIERQFGVIFQVLNDNNRYYEIEI